MCLIIHKPKNKIVPMELLEDAFISNHDGWGIMYFDGLIRVQKGFKLQQLKNAVAKHQEVELFIHLRMATHGQINWGNCHPFQVTDSIWMMHNGIIDIERETKEDSDTKSFVNFLKPILEAKPDLLLNDYWAEMISRAVDDSRLVFLTDTGESVFINKQKGIEWKGLWCSNTYAWGLWKPLSTNPLWNLKKKTKEADIFDLLTNEEELIDLNFLRSLPEDELVDLCWEDPVMVAQAIMYS